MNNANVSKYPHSQTLFKFCKKSLQQKYQGGVKIIDQDVGSILGYDPADCSHWKKGKKNIKNFKALFNLSQQLKIDFDLIKNIVTGKICLEEAEFELTGYNSLKYNELQLESIRKTYFQNKNWNRINRKLNFKEELTSENSCLYDLALKFQENITLESPVQIKNIIQNFSNYIELIHTPTHENEYQIKEDKISQNLPTKFFYKTEPIYKFIRYIILKTLYKTLLEKSHPWFSKVKELPTDTIEIHSSLFAGIILVPKLQLTKVSLGSFTTSNFIAELADKFQVSKILLGEMIRYYESQSDGDGVI